MTTEVATSAAPSDRVGRLLAFIEHDPDNLALRKDAIREACGTGRWDAARWLIDAGLQAHPDDLDMMGFSGFVQLHARRYGDAERSLLAALSGGLDDAELHYNLAFVQFMQKRYADALERVSAPAVLQALPLALVLRARCLHHLGRPEEAIADCRAHLAVAAEDAETNGLLALILYERGQAEAARPHIETALKHDPKQPEALLALASVQSASQEFDAARDSYNALLQVDSESGRAWLGLSLIELTHLQLDAAKQDIELAATHMPEHVGTWHVMAWIHIMQGNVAAAEHAFDQALALDRNFSETHGGLAVIAAVQGREADAQASIKRALRLNPQTMSAQYARMVLLRNRGQHKEALEVLDEFLARPVTNSDMQYRDLVTAHMKYMRSPTRGRLPGVHPI